MAYTRDYMYTFITTEWWDGFLETPLYDNIVSTQALIKVLNKFKVRGACWNDVIVVQGNNEILHWTKDQGKYTYSEDVERLQKMINDLVDALNEEEMHQ